MNSKSFQRFILLASHPSITPGRANQEKTMNHPHARTICCLLVISIGFAGAVSAQQDYTKSAPIFPNVFRPYAPRHVPQPNMANSARVDQLIQEGKLMLSLSDAITLALENNLDVVIARYNLPIADTDILRTKSGQSTRGINTGIVQNTPGGGVGSIGNAGIVGGGAGGTSAAAAGAGAGLGGLVSSTLGVGPPLDSYDPIFNSSLGLQHTRTPEPNTIITGVPFLSQNTGNTSFSYTQGFTSGTLLTVDLAGSRGTTNSIRNTLNPQLNSNYLIQLRQHLLQGLGFAPNRRFIVISRNDREIADIAFRQQIIFTVTQIENLYWNLVSAYEDLNAKQRALTLAQQLEANNRRQLQVGTLAQIDVVNAEAQVASAQQDVIISQTNLQLQELLMKNAVTKDENQPVLAAAPVVPTDRMQLPPVEPVVPIQDLIQEALQRRPELAQARIDLTNRRISEQAARNAMLPALDLVANYGGNSLAGTANPFCQGFGGQPCPALTPTGFSDLFTNLSANPTYFVGFNVNIPIKNRAAQADQIRSELEYRQAQVHIKQLENQIAIDVRNGQFAVQQNRARVDAATQQRNYAAQVLDAEEKKLAQGMSTTFNVLQDMSNLATAENNLVAAMTAYEQSKVQLEVVTGRTLDDLGISIADAETGNVTHMPRVPGVGPAPLPVTQPGQTLQPAPPAMEPVQPAPPQQR
jgi:outer membrane protein